jgi:hypothetical protein
MQTISVVINPLAFLEVDEPWASMKGQSVTAEDVLQFLCNPLNPLDLQALTQRYKRISVEDPRLFAAPAEVRLLERLIWPLRQAKGSFMVGNFLGTISLCGMVGEMAAILIFDLAEVRVNSVVADEARQKALFGSSFERLNQDRRVEVLRGNGLIDGRLKEAFDSIRTRRRRYLHLWSEDHAALEKDAIECFKAAVLIVVSALGFDVKDGKLIFRPQVFEYLKKHGVEPEPATGDVSANKELKLPSQGGTADPDASA